MRAAPFVAWALALRVTTAHGAAGSGPWPAVSRDAFRSLRPRVFTNEVIGDPLIQGDDLKPELEQDALRCFEVHQPVLTPAGAAVDGRLIAPAPGNSRSVHPCDEAILMTHSFANSYGNPFVGHYKPPECDFDRVVIRLDVVSEGRQFDRLGIMYLGDTEVWRTSTAEPKPQPGISWTYQKDMTAYLALWKDEQNLIFDLGNIVNDVYTGPFNTTLTATFFRANIWTDPAADAILPISARNGASGKPSAFIYPETKAETALSLPRNINRAILSVAATGQAGEEFWWSNLPEQYKNILNLDSGPLPGLSAFREVQVRLDGQLIGLSWPFPVVFTGGISPPLHRPLVGIQAFDMREHEIDISPFLGSLCDGEEHTFTLDVVGVNDSTTTAELVTVPMHWVLSGKIFLWLDDESSITTGAKPKVTVSDLDYTADKVEEAGGQIKVTHEVRRQVTATARITTQRGKKERSWRQTSLMNSQTVLAKKGDVQNTAGMYTHEDQALLENAVVLSTRARYPIASNSEYRAPDGDYDLSLTADLLQGCDLEIRGRRANPAGLEPFIDKLGTRYDGTSLKTWRKGKAFFYQYEGGNKSSGFGDSHQKYSLTALRKLQPHLRPDARGPILYGREVVITNETTTLDKELAFGQNEMSDISP